MSILSRDAILTASDINTQTVAVPEWGGDVLVRALTATQRDAFEASLVEAKSKGQRVSLVNIRAKLVSLAVVDPNGNRLFNDADVESLGSKSAAAMNRVWEAARKLSGMTEEDVEELTKNSETTPLADSSAA